MDAVFFPEVQPEIQFEERIKIQKGAKIVDSVEYSGESHPKFSGTGRNMFAKGLKTENWSRRW